MRIEGRVPEVVQTMMAVSFEYEKTAHVYAIEAQQGGSIVTPEGEMAFDAGDMIVSDVPPTHAWPVRRAVFDATYHRVPRTDGMDSNDWEGTDG